MAPLVLKAPLLPIREVFEKGLPKKLLQEYKKGYNITKIRLEGLWLMAAF